MCQVKILIIRSLLISRAAVPADCVRRLVSQLSRQYRPPLIKRKTFNITKQKPGSSRIAGKIYPGIIRTPAMAFIPMSAFSGIKCDMV